MGAFGDVCQSFNPYHPLLSLPEEAEKDWNKVYSDHLPMRSEIKIREDKPAIKITTWNILAPNVGVGFNGLAINSSEQIAFNEVDSNPRQELLNP